MTEEEKVALANLILNRIDAEWRSREETLRADTAERRAEAAEKEAEFLRAKNRILQKENDELQELLDSPADLDDLLYLARGGMADMRADMLADLYRASDGYH